MPIHSKTYTESKPENVIHKTRLGRLLNLLTSLPRSEHGTWADFGCSDGFILELVRSKIVSKEWKLYGFDFVDSLLELARQRKIENAEFIKYDLNAVPVPPKQRFDIVTCFETMEHVGNYRNAIDHIVSHVSSKGWLVISVPNETGLPGLIKFLGRLVLRKNPYGEFFRNNSIIVYVTALICYRDIEEFRSSEVTEWSVHLGFNYRKLYQYIEAQYVHTDTLILRRKESSFFGFNKIFVFQKIK